MAKLVVGTFQDTNQASKAIERLRIAGFADQDISAVMSESTGRALESRSRSRTAGTIAIGAGVERAIATMMLGMTGVGAVANGGMALVAVGPIVPALEGTDGPVGGLARRLIRVGIPEHEAKFHEGAVRKGGVLLGVRADGLRKTEAKRILEDAPVEAALHAEHRTAGRSWCRVA